MPLQAICKHDIVALGSPRFYDSALASICQSDGAAAAWKQAIRAAGPKALGSVAGDFAVALREPDGRCFLAVDRFAIHSLCYRQVGGELRFAERADDLADAGAEIDPQAIFDYLYFHAIPSPRTIFKGVYRVPPAHYVVFEKGQLTVAPYWTPTFAEETRPSFEQLRDEFLGLLKTATARQLDGGKAACFLSGGTDSSTVTGMIGQVSGGPAATYSIGFEADGYDEMAFARCAARHFKTEHHEYYITPDDLVRSIPAVAAHYDQPFGNSSALPAFYCAKMAKEDGVERLLAGDGGDELFGGNARYAKQRVFNWYRHVPGGLRKLGLDPVFGGTWAKRLPLASKAASYVEQANVPMPDRMEMYNLVMRLGIDQVLTSGMLSHVDIASPLRQQREVWKSATAKTDINRHLAFDWRYTLAESDLPKVCGTVQLAGLEVGFPMLDDALLEFSLRLPSVYKLKGLKLRWFFKEALRGFLPDEIITKKKQGFGLPFGVWFTHHDSLRKLASESIRGLVDRGILRAEFVESLLTKYVYQHPGYYGEMVWISMMLEQWLRTHRHTFSIGEK